MELNAMFITKISACGVMVSTVVFHHGDRGSNRGRGCEISYW